MTVLVEDVLVLLEREMMKYRVQVEREFAPVPRVSANPGQLQHIAHFGGIEDVARGDADELFGIQVDRQGGGESVADAGEFDDFGSAKDRDVRPAGQHFVEDFDGDLGFEAEGRDVAGTGVGDAAVSAAELLAKLEVGQRRAGNLDEFVFVQGGDATGRGLAADPGRFFREADAAAAISRAKGPGDAPHARSGDENVTRQ
jgi:hypothetical protein